MRLCIAVWIRWRSRSKKRSLNPTLTSCQRRDSAGQNWPGNLPKEYRILPICLSATALPQPNKRRRWDLKRQFIILSPLLFSAFSAIAKDLPDEHKCFDLKSTKASEVIACLSNVQKAVELDLNETYQDSMTQVMPKLRASLQKTQRLWISYRDAVCEARSDLELDGANLCVIKITKDRITDIDRFYTIRR